MNFAPPRLTRIVASAAMLSILSIGGVTGIAAASTGSSPSAISIKMATVLSPSTDTYTAQVLKLINEKRAAVGAPPVKWNQQIGNVSQDWSSYLGEATKSDSFDWNKIHRSDAGGTLIPSGATWYREIIAFNGSAQSIVDWWMGSASHRAAMLDPKATDIGIGYVIPTSGPYTGWHMVVSNLAAYPQTQTPTSGSQYKTTIQLNFRSGGGFEYPVIDSAPTGTIVTATGKASGIWYEVKAGGQTGWMSSEYLAKYVAPGEIVKTPLNVKASSLNGSLGKATSGEIYGLKNNGSYQCFELGCIIYSPESGARVSTGAIRTTWASIGFENGFLGYPTSDEVGGLRNGGAYQNYQGGSIIWSPATGAQISTGGIRTVWASTGYENGFLGYPTSNEIGGLKNGGVYQMFERGAIIWSPSTGGFVSTGGIRTLWASTGFENGRLGYPTSNEYSTGADGSVAQNYQGGVINWSSSGSSIVYK